MKHASFSFLLLGLVAFVTTGCTRLSSSPASDARVPASSNLVRTIKLPKRTLVFQPSRDDFTVRSVIFTVSQLANVPRDGVWINGVAPKRMQIHLRQVGTNRFQLPALKIQYSREAMGGPLYLALKVWFNDISNQGDPFFYQNLPDRYALLTYCTDETEDPAKVNVRWGANRAATVREFNERLAKPLTIRLKEGPMRPDVNYPVVNDAFFQLAPADISALKELVGGQGEKYLFAITVLSSDHASVHTSVTDATEFYGSRIYHLVKAGGKWRIEEVEYTPNSF
jgi:hypothetical protein